MKLYLKFAAISLVVSNAFSGGVTTSSKVTRLMTDKSYPHSVFVKLSNAPSGKPACSSSSNWDYVLYDDTQMGKNMLSMLLTAYSTGSIVTIIGDGYCSGESEKIQQINLN